MFKNKYMGNNVMGFTVLIRKKRAEPFHIVQQLAAGMETSLFSSVQI